MKNSIKSGVVIVSVVIFTILSVCVVALIGAFYNSTFPFDDEYAIVFDAGSSSTKMYVYSWKEGLSVSTGDRVNITEKLRCEHAPGIDKITSQNDVTLYFDQCIGQARKIVLQNKRNRTFITLGATAGMRLLNASNPTLVNNTLNYIRNYFSNTEFLYQNASQVQVLTGKDEGLYAWITANYFLNKYDSGSQSTQNYGILDLGGASGQISFLPEKSSYDSNVNNFFTNVRVYGVDYNPYSGSFLCYGVNEILLVYYTYLIIKNNYATSLNGACFSSGSFQNVSTSSLLASNCASGLIFKYPTALNKTRLSASSYYVINGQSDATACTQDVSDLFPTSVCNYGTCSFNDVFLPNKKQDYFLAFSNYYNAINNTEILSGNTLKKNLTAYQSELTRLCGLTYSQLTTINGGIITDRFLRTVCFNNQVVSNMLTKNSITSFDNVKISLDVNGNTIGWSLGYLFNQINRDDFLPVEDAKRRLPYDFFVPAMTISVILTGLLLISLIVFIIVSSFKNKISN